MFDDIELEHNDEFSKVDGVHPFIITNTKQQYDEYYYSDDSYIIIEIIGQGEDFYYTSPLSQFCKDFDNSKDVIFDIFFDEDSLIILHQVYIA